MSLLLLFALTACVGPHGRELHSDVTTLAAVADSPYLKAHLRDGGVVVWVEWQVTDERVGGQGWALDPNRRLPGGGTMGSLPASTVSVAIDDVALFETNDSRPDAAIVAMTVVTVASLALTAVCMLNPKTCFGSCPTFYVEHDGEEHLDAEGFSEAIAPSLERTDIDAMPHASAVDGTLRVTMRNEALETHVVRGVSVLAVPRPDGRDVFHGPDDRFFAAGPAVAPSSCEAAEGDCLATVAAADRIERTSPADARDLAARETVRLRFDDVPRGPLGVVVDSRQGLVHTFVFYSALDALGPSATTVLARFESGGADLGGGPRGMPDALSGVAGALGGIDVEVKGDAGWQPVGTLHEMGPLATHRRVLPFEHENGRGVDLRLTMAAGGWRLDRVAIVSLGPEVEPTRHPVREVVRDATADADALTALLDPDRAVTTLPGDALELWFDVPDDTALFLESRGYYLEWMREDWVRGHRRALLAQTVRDPAKVLRTLAPEYKRIEPTIEEQFWSSRYARP